MTVRISSRNQPGQLSVTLHLDAESLPALLILPAGPTAYRVNELGEVERLSSLEAARLQASIAPALIGNAVTATRRTS